MAPTCLQLSKFRGRGPNILLVCHALPPPQNFYGLWDSRLTGRCHSPDAETVAIEV